MRDLTARARDPDDRAAGRAPGRYRRTGVRVVGGGKVHHVGPPAARVPQLVAGLLAKPAGTFRTTAA